MKALFLTPLILALAFVGGPSFKQPSDEFPLILNSEETVGLLYPALNMPEPDWLVGPEDSVYLAPTAEQIKELLSFIKDRRQLIHYAPSASDCDDFATEAKYWATIWNVRNYAGVNAALFFGKAYVKLDGNYSLLFPQTGNAHITGYHVLNFVVRADGKAFFFEPQSGCLAEVESFIYEGSIEVLRLEY